MQCCTLAWMRSRPSARYATRAAQVGQLCFLILPCVSSACTPLIYSPPARPIAQATAGTLGKARSAVQVNSSYYGAFAAFGGGGKIVAASVQGRHGLTDGLDVVVDASLFRILNNTVFRTGNSTVDNDPNIFAMRVGVKQRLHQHFAVFGGLGGGYSPAAGAFLSPDLGVVASSRQCYLDPFFSLSGFLSVPLAPRTLVIGITDDREPIEERTESAYGFALAVGFKIPLTHDHCGSGPPRVAVTISAAVTDLIDSEASTLFFSGTGGFEVAF